MSHSEAPLDPLQLAIARAHEAKAAAFWRREPAESAFASIQDAAWVLNCSDGKVRRLIKSGNIPTTKRGPRIRLDLFELLLHVARLRHAEQARLRRIGRHRIN